jgi:hypothetical protein
MSDEPLDLDRHRGMAAQSATVIRRILAEVENNARSLRDRQGILESQLLAVPAASWPEAAAVRSATRSAFSWFESYQAASASL